MATSSRFCFLFYTRFSALINATIVFYTCINHAGCILAELYTGYPIFPGENEIEQLACIMEVLDVPPDGVIAHASRKRLFFGKYINTRSY